MWWQSETGHQEALLLGEATEVPGLALSLTGLESQSYPCPQVDHIWEGGFIPSSLRHINQQRCCLFTRRNRAVRQASPSFCLNQYVPQ